MCAGGCYVFRTSKPHSGTLCNVLNDGEQCLKLNFWSKRLFALPEFTISTEQNIPLNIVTFGIKCTIVVIGGKFLKQIDEIMSMVHKKTEHNDWTKVTRAKDMTYMPSAVFLMTEKPGQDIMFNVSIRYRWSPTMYQVPASSL